MQANGSLRLRPVREPINSTAKVICFRQKMLKKPHILPDMGLLLRAEAVVSRLARFACYAVSAATVFIIQKVV